MNLSKLGEFGLIARIAKQFAANSNGDIHSIGDDCAVIPYQDNKSLLLTTDSLVENTHFIRAKIPAKALGYKSAAVSISDIAAMGGTPKFMLASVALPKNIKASWIDDFLAGLQAGISQYQVQLVGGDTVSSESDIFINITVIGTAENDKIKYRSSAKPGDIICVTDNLGDSAAGLYCILHNIKNSRLIERHYFPKPQIVMGQFLASFSAVHAMLDVSDGISSDLLRICEQSNCGAEIELTNLPTSAELQTFCAQNRLNNLEIAATSGEEYCLLFTVEPNFFAELSTLFKQEFSSNIYQIGKINSDPDEISYTASGAKYNLSAQEFKHF